MTKLEWRHSVDRWMEDRLWSRVPAHISSPHFFWFFGFICGTIFSLVTIYIIK